MSAQEMRSCGILTGQVSLITGGARGIGFGIGLEMARAGSRVILASRSVNEASEAAARIVTMGADAAAIRLDVTDEQAVQSCVRSALDLFGRIDVLVNNAGVHAENIGELSTVRSFHQCFDVNLFGVWRMTQAIVPHFRVRGGGKIINIASINGRRPWVDTPAYSASKAALINLTQSLAATLGADNINVNAICPGGVMTDMAERFKAALPGMFEVVTSSRALQRPLFPEDIGKAAVFFASSYAQSITGQCLNVDGGTVMN